MSKLSNQTIVEKADLAVSNLVDDGGYLNPMQADAFLRILINQPTILNTSRIIPMNSPNMEINRIGFMTRILHGAPASGTNLADEKRVSPETEKLILTTSEIMAEIHLPYDVMEDNIERASLESTIMQMIAEHAALDLEELLILGDEDNSADDLLKLQDGILVLATRNVVAYDDPPELYDVNMFKTGIQAMPLPYLRNRAALRFFTSHLLETEFAALQSARFTMLGDNRLEGDYSEKLKAFGISIVPCALMPDGTYILTHPQNIIVGIQRRLQIETWRDIRARQMIVVLTMRIAQDIEEPRGIVKVTGLAAPAATT
jgi:hypothetical protein